MRQSKLPLSTWNSGRHNKSSSVQRGIPVVLWINPVWKILKESRKKLQKIFPRIWKTIPLDGIVRCFPSCNISINKKYLYFLRKNHGSARSIPSIFTFPVFFRWLRLSATFIMVTGLSMDAYLVSNSVSDRKFFPYASCHHSSGRRAANSDESSCQLFAIPGFPLLANYATCKTRNKLLESRSQGWGRACHALMPRSVDAADDGSTHRA